MTDTSTMTPRRAATARPHRGESAEDRGYSFPEILVAIVLMGTVMVAVMTGMFTAIRASAISDDSADLDAVLGAAAEALNDTLFIACPAATTTNGYLATAQRGANALGWHADTVQIVSVAYWDPTTAPGDQRWIPTNGIGGDQCDPGAWMSSAKTMQKLTIEATTPNGKASRQLEIVMTDTRPKVTP